ncbi:MAG: cytochrome c oxidase accessory protein CcoG [Phycisphaerales bacterium]|nr:cytochrome c oxidase accessory protein CcoG [Phycisphaerales bacterium]
MNPGRDLNAPPPPEQVLSTLNEDGSRRWLRPKLSIGRFWRSRRAVAYILIAIFTAIPYLTWGGKPLVLLDLASRRFTILGKTFLPTDTLLLALLMVSIFVTIFLLTALFGRVWCGWACPQTVYMEFVFRPIERFFEGSPGRSSRGFLRGTPAGKIAKYIVYLVISLYLAHTFLAYFVGVERLATWVTRSPFEHPAGFLIVVIVTALMMFDFCFFREQTCIVACPYGRFQSVMLDRNSVIVSYDPARGEPRGRASRRKTGRGDVALHVLADEPPKGDCVDCGLCVTTCPTGIDIRNGLQMECIHCAQCIDACDSVMAKLARPLGLIRYSSQAAIAGEKPRVLRPRVIIYPLILFIVVTAFIFTLSTKSAADVTVLRGMGRPFTPLASGEIENAIRVKIVNRSERSATYTVSIVGEHGGRIESEGLPMMLGPGQVKSVPAMVIVPSTAFGPGHYDVLIRITDGGEFSKDTRYRLLGPASAARPPTGHEDDKHDADDKDHKDEQKEHATPSRENPR